MTYHQQKGHGYGHVTVLKFCGWLRCSASQGFVSDSCATCHVLVAGYLYTSNLVRQLIIASPSILRPARVGGDFQGRNYYRTPHMDNRNRILPMRCCLHDSILAVLITHLLVMDSWTDRQT